MSQENCSLSKKSPGYNSTDQPQREATRACCSGETGGRSATGGQVCPALTAISAVTGIHWEEGSTAARRPA